MAGIDFGVVAGDQALPLQALDALIELQVAVADQVYKQASAVNDSTLKALLGLTGVEGDLQVADGRIGASDQHAGGDLDLAGDFLIPGLVDIHTDNIEHHMQPRPGVRWPSPVAAMIAHDWDPVASCVGDGFCSFAHCAG